MSAIRKVDNLLALAVLAELSRRPMHRYELGAILKAHGKERDMNVKLSSLYTVVDNLEKHGFLESIGTSRHGGRPERTTYRITEDGRQEMLGWTRELLSTPLPERPQFVAGLSIMMVLPPDDVIALLGARAARLEQTIAMRRAELAELQRSVPRLFLSEDEYALAMLEAEAAWVRSMSDELATGSHPDVAAWREWHRSGTAPADIEAPADAGAPAAESSPQGPKE